MTKKTHKVKGRKCMYKENTAKPQLVASLLKESGFAALIEPKKNILDYSKKITTYAQRFECWDGADLVGLVAVYCNDPKREVAFITCLGVHTDYQGKGLASKLLDKTIKHCEKENFALIRLEVLRSNKSAIALYKKFEFVDDESRTQDTTNEVSMTRRMK